MRILPILLFGGALLAGCASPQPVRQRVDTATGVEVLASAPVRIQTQRNQALGMQGRQLLTVQALAPCADAGCRPDQVVLVLENVSDTEVWLNYRRVRIEADGAEFEWDDLTPNEGPVRVPPGEVLRVPMAVQDLVRLAHATDVTGAIGDVPFRLGYDDRAPLRALAARIVS